MKRAEIGYKNKREITGIKVFLNNGKVYSLCFICKVPCFDKINVLCIFREKNTKGHVN